MIRCDKHYRKFKLNAKYEDFEEVEEKKKEEEENEEQIEEGEQFANKGDKILIYKINSKVKTIMLL